MLPTKMASWSSAALHQQVCWSSSQGLTLQHNLRVGQLSLLLHTLVGGSFKNMAGKQALHGVATGACAVVQDGTGRGGRLLAACPLPSGLLNLPSKPAHMLSCGCLGGSSPCAQLPGQFHASHWLVVAAVQPSKQCPLGSSHSGMQLNQWPSASMTCTVAWGKTRFA